MAVAALFRSPDDHLRALTGLRGIAAGWVLVYHAWQFAGGPRALVLGIDLTPLLACGFFGVDLFFVLSGFLLGRPFIRARMQLLPMPSPGRFWVRRLRRVLPAYWVQLAVLLALGTATLSEGELLAHATLIFNVAGNTSPLNPVYWSLPVEWNFYMVLPLLALGFLPVSGRPLLLPLALAFALAFRFACGWVLQQYGADGVEFYRWILQLPARIDQFVIGMVAAWLSLSGFAARRRTPLALAGIGIVLLQSWLTAPRGDFISGADMAWLYWHYPVLACGFALLIAAVADDRGVLARLLGIAPLGFLGLISYSLYLWHYPVLGALAAHAGKLDPVWLWAVAAPAASIVLATVSYVLVERPFLRPGTAAAVPAVSAP